MCDTQRIVALASASGYKAETLDEVDAVAVTHEDGTQIIVVQQGDELLMESIIAPTSRAKAPDELNAAILSTHHRLFPMTAVGINQIDGESYYVAFSVLPSIAQDATVVSAMESLFDGVLDITHALRNYFS